jgi:hypothetical protein
VLGTVGGDTFTIGDQVAISVADVQARRSGALVNQLNAH